MTTETSRSVPGTKRTPSSDATRIDPADWVRLTQAETLEQLVSPWLTLQMTQLDAKGAVLFTVTRDGPRLLASAGEIDPDQLAEIAVSVIDTGKPVTMRSGVPGEPARVGHPVFMEGQLKLIVSITLGNPNPARVRQAARGLVWGAAWLREKLTAQAAEQAASRLDTMHKTHEVFAAGLEEDRFRSAALTVVTRLAHVSGANRVSLGLRRRDRTIIHAISHSAEFGKRMALNRRVAAAMDEAIDQRAALSHPDGQDQVNANRAQEELSREHGPSAVLTLPFRVAGLHQGAFTFERPASQPFTAQDVARLDFMSAMLGPVLHEKQQNDRWLIFKIFATLRNQLARLLGPRYLGRKLAVLIIAGLTALFMTWKGTYQVTADATIEGAIERSIVAPFDGYLRTAPHRAGDTVEAGEIVAALDERDLALERLRWMTEKRQRELEYGRAISEQARSEAEIVRTQIAQADAQIKLIDEQMARASIVAPFDGVIVTGDQSQNIGGTVRRGDVLFEIAPLEGYRIVMEVDETRIGDVSNGQSGTLVVTALPNDAYAFKVEQLTPIAIASDGRNFFRTEASLQNASNELRPGMSGVAKIAIDERLVIEIWTRAMADWIRLTFWKWFG